MKEDLKFALAMYGGSSVTLTGTAMMQVWPAPSWDIHQMVSCITTCMCYMEGSYGGILI